MHKELSILCLKNKKAVLCEKPVTLNEEEAVEVINCAKENETFFMEAMKTRFLPVHKEVKRMVEDGEIGEVRLIQADFGFYTEFDEKNRLFDPKLGGGALLDVGVYPISYGTWLMGGEPVDVKSNIFIGKTGVDENVSAIISYENGREVNTYGAINLNTVREANIVGTKGTLRVPRFSSGEKLIINMNGKEEVKEFPFAINGFEYQIEEVNTALRNGKLESEIMSWNESITVMRTLDKIKK
jgi:predicted dehydrogenase